MEFTPFPKIPRFSKDVIITEKIDGTNACVWVNDTGDDLRAASRTRWVTPNNDNHGFAKWVEKNKSDLLKLGPGFHYGEWWGKGIQRGYGGHPKTFSLFNVSKWSEWRPECCSIVPVLSVGSFDEVNNLVGAAIEDLRAKGSYAAPGFMRPEGVVIYHVAGNYLFKKTLEKDEKPKGEE